MTELATRYLGLRLRNPLVASASPLARTLEGVERLADAGIAAVVLPSLFEEEVRREAAADATAREAGSERVGEARTYFPAPPPGQGEARQYLSLLERSAEHVDIPVIGSLNGVSASGWTGFAHAMQEAGAAAIELNLSTLPGGLGLSGREVEQRHVDILSRVKATVRVPVAVKLGPQLSSTGEMARRLDEAGADGLVLFNRFAQLDIDPDRLALVPAQGLSSPGEARLARTWISLLHGRLRCDLAASTGVESAADLASYLLAGADVVMSTSALLRHGPGYARVLLEGLTEWMARSGFERIEEARGLLAAVEGESPRVRADYVDAMQQANRGDGAP